MGVLTFNDEFQTAKKPKQLDISPAEWRQFANWALVWLGIANIAFVALWFVGAPPRAHPIMVAGLVGLLVRKLPTVVQFLAFLGSLMFSTLHFIAGTFNLNILSLFHSIKFMAELQPTGSIEYQLVALLGVAMCIGAWFAVRRDSAFGNWRLLVLAAICVLALANVDKWMGEGMRGHYKRVAVAGAPFESAMSFTGAEQTAIAGKRNLAIIMVESLGVPAGNAEMEQLLFKAFDDPAIRERFSATRGTTLYYNSTTAGEVREMCGRWGDYQEIVEAGGDRNCLPARMKRAGYSTHAFHSFNGSFFERDTWYPGIGFDESRFRDRLMADGAEECGGVFPGACDRDIPAQLARQLKQGGKPQLVYWLTVNSHLPVPTGANLEVENCERISPELAREFPMICRQFALWDAWEKALVKELQADDFPPTDFLIVGDHMPPYFDRRHRVQFAPDRVPYLYLKWRGDAPRAASNGR
ncbi:sulfatase-like hydrolase/transferase [Erythrobacter sp. SDW2]|uniref:sulfatase-like hydrolase/transferase n=1 Tax=Erythrobacter sp. SDW2 TaxID=2907154 RepID=UPI001F227257|nr:sulfatase-like hydrolase/transferase [Erythrobacter sp. SDW2]UIP07214.1 sulfatase-like hydrolase/transferase [Erythrobacter sp. SDW2]